MTDDENLNSNKKNIKIFVRILPLEKPCESCAKIDIEHKTICIRCLHDLQLKRLVKIKDQSYWCFRTDGIFYNSSQEDVYCVTAKELLEKVLSGINCVLFSYGHTGSGKSFTISGFRNNWEHRGVVMRLLSDMFAEKRKRKNVTDISYHLSFLEFRGKETADLLVADTKNTIRINENDAFKNVTINHVKNEEIALKQLFEGESRRSVVKGSSYPASHLGTAVITFHVSSTSLITSWAVMATAKIHIVEMAGTGTVGKNNCLKPAIDVGTANLSQYQLERFFMYLRGFEPSANVVVRSSNLLKFLGRTISVTSIIRFIAHICIAEESLDAALSTLRFGSLVSKLKPVKSMHQIVPRNEQIIGELRNQVNVLKKELDLNDIFFKQEQISNMSTLRKEQINRSIMNFLNGTISDLTLYNVSQMEVLLKIMKELHDNLALKRSEVEKLGETYENALKSMSKVVSLSAPTLPMKALHVSISGSSKQSQIQNAERVSAPSLGSKEKEQVGILNKEGGITLGPVIGGDLESELKLAKHFKGTAEKCPTAMMDMKDNLEFFEQFLQEDEKYSRLRRELDQNDNNLNEMRRDFTNLMEEYTNVKMKFEITRVELEKQQKIRHCKGTENYDEEGKIIVPETEKKLVDEVACLKNKFMKLQSDVDLVQNEIFRLKEIRKSLCCKLQIAFQEYCRKAGQLPTSDEDCVLPFGILERHNKSTENIKRKFKQLQRTILRTYAGKKTAKLV